MYEKYVFNNWPTLTGVANTIFSFWCHQWQEGEYRREGDSCRNKVRMNHLFKIH